MHGDHGDGSESVAMPAEIGAPSPVIAAVVPVTLPTGLTADSSWRQPGENKIFDRSRHFGP
jgi:hypothetical protein